jgi:CPA2 family monovalent cation:H+ antiporter-2
LPHTVSLDDYRSALIFLMTAGVIAPLFRRIKVSPVIGYLAAGMVLGPFGIGRFEWAASISLPDGKEIAQLAEFGVVFLLFTIGLELSFERLKRMRKLVFGLGAMQVIGCALCIGLVAIFFGERPESAAVIGGALALSSTAIVIPVLAERRR